MKIKTKASLLSFFWLISILIPLTFIIYYLYAQYEKEEELESLQFTANQMLTQISPMELLQEDNNRILRRYLPDHSMIRSLNLSSKVINQVANNDELAVIPPKHMDTQVTYSQKLNEQTVMIVRTPIRQGTEIIGTLEIITEPIELDQSLYRLVGIIGIVTLAAMLLSLSASFLLTKLLFLPLSRMIQTMKEIETSLAITKLPLNRKSKDELYQLSETFNHLMERIEISMKKQRQFISDASHEFKTSLTIIEGYSSLIRRWGFENIDLHMEALNAVHDESKRMKHITYQLLELAELDHEPKLTLSLFDLVTLCKENIQLLQPLSDKEFILIPTESSIMMEADRPQMKQVLFIILDNAMKYMKHHTRIYLSQTDSNHCIRIVDDGIGIPAEELPFVFERFYRVDRSRSRQTGGSGLGLAIAKCIVSLHHGTIQIASDRHNGTEVIVTIPKLKTSNPF
ncbi:HAMP domain-containing histidine kinase [Paenibacillus sp. CGMCC 1.16610]|uniref:Signal transduction histidine-protein kinase ArlS n=1 Tax=Paenibacillus anseongense TaxID=2682845 RepID=A0ABW9TZD3_9BACL|nr:MULTISPECIES: HAMP domain-containing histidine kinase [Paenibacillus]MBA2936872.1 HAMP domain-containing histidine kinase [Paenibacillus sp. CGMCC 1.16610]MVQ33199.1 HAMP domain-containing protein [Paenibacillus anseongense]